MDIDLKNCRPPYFIHSDVFAVRDILSPQKRAKNINDLLSAHHEYLQDVFGSELIFPAFNYDFGGSRIFNVEEDKIQVGGLPEFLRTKSDYKRTCVPFFSALTKSDIYLNGNKGQITPFGRGSIFEYLHKRNGTIVFYGADFSSFTFIHYIEDFLGPPSYRYDKTFEGVIESAGRKKAASLGMHVRPLGKELDYGWHKMEQDLSSSDVLVTSQAHPKLKFAACQALIDYYETKLSEEPFYMLDSNCRQTFIDLTAGGTKRLTLEDFEDV